MKKEDRSEKITLEKLIDQAQEYYTAGDFSSTIQYIEQIRKFQKIPDPNLLIQLLLLEARACFLLSNKLSIEHDKSFEKPGVWDLFQQKRPPFATRPAFMQFETEIDRIKRQKPWSPEPAPRDKPIALLLINENGPLLYSMSLDPDWEGDHQLLGGLLSAFNSLSSELFPKSFERAKFGAHSILAKHVPPIIFGYVYLGKSSSYMASLTLTRFIRSVQKRSDIWDSFVQATLFSNMIPTEITTDLEQIVRRLFLTN